MNVEKKILKILTKYFRREETDSERKELYQWYDQIDQTALSSKADIEDLHQRSKARVFTSIREQTPINRRVFPFWSKITAAAALLVVGYFSYDYFVIQERYESLPTSQLASISPGTHTATITLSTGEVINLDDLDRNESITAGNTIIQKDSAGRITYLSTPLDSKSNRINTMQTPRAGQYNIVLSDGTKVFLNAESKLTYPESFGKGDRIVTLDGEAYFEVSKTTAQSRFIVRTEQQSTEVLGTKFNINAYKDEAAVKTTLAEGSIRVFPEQREEQSITLHPDQQTVLSDHAFSRQAVDADNAIGWTKGLFCFDGTNSEDIIRQISRWYDIDVEYNKGKNPITYSGKIPKNISLDKLIQLLNYADIKAYAVSNKKNERKLIIN